MKRKLIFIFIGILFYSLSFAGISKGPYLLNVGKFRVTVAWESDRSEEGRVEYGLSPQYGNVVNAPLASMHKVALTNLTPGTLYHYKVVSGGAESGDHTFSTAVMSGEPFRFVAYGDNRTNHDDHQMVVNAIMTASPDFIINTGDLVDLGINPSDWVDFFRIETPLISNSPLFAAMGNHELGADLFWNKYFEAPPEQPSAKYYGFSHGNAHFICIDTNSLLGPFGDQYNWIIAELDRAMENSAIDFIIPFFHNPPYSSSNHGSNITVRNTLKPLFDARNSKVKLVFTGHDHNYEHALVEGIHYIVTGGGGAPLYGNGHESWTIYSEKAFHYCLVDVSNSLLQFSAIRMDGTVMDSFNLEPPSTPTPTPTPSTTRTPTTTPTNTPTISTPTPTNSATPTGITATPTLSPSFTPTSTPTPAPIEKVKIFLGGYWNTRLNYYGGLLQLIAFVPDPIDTLQVFYEGIPCGLYLTDDGISGDFEKNDRIYGMKILLSEGLPPVRLLLALAPEIDWELGDFWPYLNVGN